MAVGYVQPAVQTQVVEAHIGFSGAHYVQELGPRKLAKCDTGRLVQPEALASKRNQPQDCACCCNRPKQKMSSTGIEVGTSGGACVAGEAHSVRGQLNR